MHDGKSKRQPGTSIAFFWLARDLTIAFDPNILAPLGLRVIVSPRHEEEDSQEESFRKEGRRSASGQGCRPEARQTYGWETG